MTWRLTGIVRGQVTLLTMGKSKEDIYARAAQALKGGPYSLEEVEPLCVWRWGKGADGTECWIYVEDLRLRKAGVHRMYYIKGV